MRTAYVVAALLVIAAVAAVPMFNKSRLLSNNEAEKIGLCFKEAPDWECQKDVFSPKGDVLYQIVGDKLEIRLYADNLPEADGYQVTLNGNGLNVDLADEKLASMASDAWHGGMWGSEGFLNIEMLGQPDYYKRFTKRLTGDGFWNVEVQRLGKYSAKWTVELPVGVYLGQKFIVKAVDGVDEAHPWGQSWTPVLMEESQLNYVVTG